MRISRLVLSLLLAPAASAGVIVVDSNNGHGTDFTSLSAAIAAASDGDVLLLRGNFDGNFVVTGKALALVADTSGATVSNSNLGDPNVPALQLGSDVDGTILLSGVQLSTPIGGGIPLVVSGTSAAGRHLLVEGINIPSANGVGMKLANGSPMTLAHCYVSGGNGHLDGAGLPSLGAPALLLESGPLVVAGGIYTGGAGLAAGVYGGTPFPGQAGQAGLQVHAADSGLKLLCNASFDGGRGGAGANVGGCLSPGDGGFGVLVTLGGNVKILNAYGVGGLGGTAAPGCGADGAFGDYLGAVAPGQMPTWLNGGGAAMSATRVVREGGTVTVYVQAGTDSTTALLVGVALQSSTLPKYFGVMQVEPLFTVDLPAAPPTGTIVLNQVVPELGPGVESMTLYIQVVSKYGPNIKAFGDITSTVLLDRRF